MPQRLPLSELIEKNQKMKFGIQTGFGKGDPLNLPVHMTAIGKGAEERGFNSIWAPEHVLQFTEYRSPYPYSDDGVPPLRTDQGILGPFTTLTFLAAHTKTLRLGTGIAILPQHNPVYFAKHVADVDVLSGGRLIVGIGTGWLEQEFDALQVPFEHRGSRTRDYLQMMKSLWEDKISSFDGKYYKLPESIQLPKPVQKPHPPLFFGGESNPALRRVAQFGQGWMGYRLTPDTLPERLEKLTAMLKEHGRTLDEIELSISPYDKPCDLDMVKRFSDLGVKQIIVMLAPDSTDKMINALDAYAEELVIPAAKT